MMSVVEAAWLGTGLGAVLGSVFTVMVMRHNYPRLPYDVRLTIAREIWSYQELDVQFGRTFDYTAGLNSLAANLAKEMCIDEAERIRVALEREGIR